MKELEYPFDSEYIIANKKRLRRELLIDSEDFVQVRIAILGGSTTSNIRQVLELFLMNNHIKTDFYESEYNQYFEEAMFPNERLEIFKPDIIYICTSNHNIQSYPAQGDTPAQIEKMVKTEIRRYTGIWDRLCDVYRCSVIQNNFELPYYRLRGNRDSYDVHGAVNFVTRLNMEFYKYAQHHEKFHICDLNYISADYGLKKWSDPFYWYMYKYAVAVPAIPYLSFNVANIVKSLMGRNKKGFVCDLDHTLWGGIIGEDGADNIRIGQEEAEGQAYLAFQKYIKAHKQLGVILAVNSKNEKENAILGLNHPDGALSEQDFICIKANWNPKDINFKEIADEISLLPESLVFLDDNPAERHIVTNQIPGVKSPELTDVSHYIELVDRSGFFETTAFSDEDKKRAEMYEENRKRAVSIEAFSNYGDYLESLQMRAVIRPFEELYMPRIAQLTNKSNQFNLTTRRYTQPEIEEAASSSEYITLYGKLEDKFGDNGVVSLVIGNIRGLQCHIDLWLMSCRVLKRDMEFAMMDALAARCKTKGITEIVGYYYPTAKNHMVERFYEEMGFVKKDDLDDGGTVWNFLLTEQYERKNKYIEVEDGNNGKR